MNRAILLGAWLLLFAVALAQKPPLTHDVYDQWRSLSNITVSDDGEWAAYVYRPQEGDPVAEIVRADDETRYSVELGNAVEIVAGKYAVVTLVPDFATQEREEEEEIEREKREKNDLLIIDLATGERMTIERVANWSAPEEGNRVWIAYRPEPPIEEPKEETKEEEPKEGEEPQEKEESQKKKEHKPGEPLVLLNLETAAEVRLEHVAEFEFSHEGELAAYSVSTPDGLGDGVFVMDPAAGTPTAVLTGLGRYPSLVFHEESPALAILTDRDDYEAEKPAHAIYLLEPGAAVTKLAASSDSAGIPSGHWIESGSNLSFSKSGERLFFTTRPRPVEPNGKREEIEVEVDVWHWQDAQLMPQQLLQADRLQNQAYEAVIHLDEENRIVALASEELPNPQVSDEGDGKYALGSTAGPTEIERSWAEWSQDYYAIDVTTGRSELIVKELIGFLALSPTGRYALGADGETRSLFVIDLATMSRHEVPDAGVSFFDELDDHPSAPGPYGLAGWTEGDDWVLVYDRYDIWAIDPEGQEPMRNVTNRVGRQRGIRFRYEQVDPEEEFIATGEPIWLSAFDEETKRSGWWTDTIGENTSPEMVVMEEADLGSLIVPKESEGRVYFRRGTFELYPELYAADADFTARTKLTTTNPQQSEYNWGTAELVEWTSLDGIPLQGILIKPEDFDPAKQYPMMVYFYERSSDGLYNYRSPAPSASTINLTYFASNGYVVFVPDIVYKVGYPGESAINSVMPGVSSVLAKGFVDTERVGIQGQSWGGYQVAYMVTETDMFAAAGAGAPVSNMFSAYGGIRWGSGLVRAFQYEHGQSRIGGSIWEETLRFVENSPIFFVDKIKTPLLIMHNDSDGAVPWYQSIEMFSAMRRLQKRAWLLVYNDEAHNLRDRDNRKDLSIRLSQFFDHYLKGAPMPVWMARGIPATEKGKTLGYPLIGNDPPWD